MEKAAARLLIGAVLVLAKRKQGTSKVNLPVAPAKIPTSDHIWCYACGTTDLARYPDFLSGIIDTPGYRYTNSCQQIRFNHLDVSLRPCSVGCVTIRFDNKIFGKSVSSYYRGCVRDLKGVDVPTLRRVYRRGCQQMDIAKVFPARQAGLTELMMCVCFKDQCNSALQIPTLSLLYLCLALLFL